MSTIGIISIGDMGLGIATLLIAHKFPVTTTLSQRSEATKLRASSANITILPDDAALVEACDVILSIVPPRDALATAERVRDALLARKGEKSLYYLDLNAVSPRSARKIAETLAVCGNVVFIDGGIIGGPPKLKSNGATTNSSEAQAQAQTNPTPPPPKIWSKPNIPLSGPVSLTSLSPSGPSLAAVLNTRHISPTIGSASGLKMCFASMSKGLTAIAIQAFTTAYTLGVHDELRRNLEEVSPKTGDLVQAGLVGMPPKAYRWVAEMREIDETFRSEGGFGGSVEVGAEGAADAVMGKGMFEEVARVYETVAYDTELGKERTEDRKRGMSTDDVAKLMMEGLARKVKTE